jgi:hypothetical protein
VLDRTDKTFFDDYAMARVDYRALRHWLSHPEHQIPGVKYHLLAEHLNRQDLKFVDLRWAMDLASVHAFLSHWRTRE